METFTETEECYFCGTEFEGDYTHLWDVARICPTCQNKMNWFNYGMLAGIIETIAVGFLIYYLFGA